MYGEEDTSRFEMDALELTCTFAPQRVHVRWEGHCGLESPSEQLAPFFEHLEARFEGVFGAGRRGWWWVGTAGDEQQQKHRSSDQDE